MFIFKKNIEVNALKSLNFSKNIGESKIFPIKKILTPATKPEPAHNMTLLDTPKSVKEQTIKYSLKMSE